MLILVNLMLVSACLPGVLPFDSWTYGGQKGPDNWPLVCATGTNVLCTNVARYLTQT